MTSDVRTLLRDAAETPQRGPDLDRVMRTARTRRRRQRGLGAVAAVVVVALVVVGVVVSAAGSDDDPSVAIRPGQTPPISVPDGWRPLHVDPGIDIAIPSGWDQYDFGHASEGATRIAVGTSQPSIDRPAPCVASADAGTWLTVWEYADASASRAGMPGGPSITVIDRPSSFDSVPWATSGCDEGAVEFTAFRDGGRLFAAAVVTTLSATAPASSSNGTTLPTPAQLEQLELGVHVLDTLRVSPLDDGADTDATTTTTTVQRPSVSTPPSLPISPATTAAPFVPTTADEQAIADVFLRWMDNYTDDDFRALVEDADAILPAIHEGLAQHSPEDLDKYSGTVSSVRMLDADHAEVQYTYLFAGSPMFGLRNGVAVRIDGHWLVSRATMCSMLSLGGITCPPE